MSGTTKESKLILTKKMHLDMYNIRYDLLVAAAGIEPEGKAESM